MAESLTLHMAFSNYDRKKEKEEIEQIDKTHWFVCMTDYNNQQ